MKVHVSKSMRDFTRKYQTALKKALQKSLIKFKLDLEPDQIQLKIKNVTKSRIFSSTKTVLMITCRILYLTEDHVKEILSDTEFANNLQTNFNDAEQSIKFKIIEISR